MRRDCGQAIRLSALNTVRERGSVGGDDQRESGMDGWMGGEIKRNLGWFCTQLGPRPSHDPLSAVVDGGISEGRRP